MLRCLLATVGKDAPGVNALIRAGTRLALRSDMEVYGAKRGFLGILQDEFHKMKESDVGSIINRGGSLLGSTDFRVESRDSETLIRIAKSLERFDVVIAAGGIGSYSIFDRLYEADAMGITTTMFIPASIENEFLDPYLDSGLEGGVHAEAIGADTAANTGIQSLDRLREQSYMSKTVFLVECVGLKSNFLPIQIGAACGAHRIYLPPYPRITGAMKKEIQKHYGERFDPHSVDPHELVGWIERCFQEDRRRYLVVIVPNGSPLLTMSQGTPVSLEQNYLDMVTSISPMELTVPSLVDQLLVHFSGPDTVQIRYVVIDDLQLGGTPTLRDRMLGSLYGEAAVEEFLSVLNAQDTKRRGNLNLLAIDDTSRVGWKCHPREEVLPIFSGKTPRAGGLDPLPFFRQMRGTVSGYRPWAEL